jgi:predicted neutral ceramidase superfamily lipid hydrolase
MKNKISSIIAMVFVMGIYMIYSITFSTSMETLTNQQLIDYYYIKYIAFPILIALVSFGLILFGFHLNRKEDIRI